jgi:hypothetical protein
MDGTPSSGRGRSVSTVPPSFESIRQAPAQQIMPNTYPIKIDSSAISILNSFHPPMSTRSSNSSFCSDSHVPQPLFIPPFTTEIRSPQSFPALLKSRLACLICHILHSMILCHECRITLCERHFVEISSSSSQAAVPLVSRNRKSLAERTTTVIGHLIGLVRGKPSESMV